MVVSRPQLWNVFLEPYQTSRIKCFCENAPLKTHIEILFYHQGLSRKCPNEIKYILLKKWSFPLRISSVNVTKSARSCGFGHIYWKMDNLMENFVFCAVIFLLGMSQSLTHISPMLHFYNPWKCQKTIGFLMFSGGMEMWYWTKMS